MRLRGFTLIEIMAVVTIVTLVAGVAVVGLASTGETARLHSAVAAWQDLDAQARLFARSAGPVRMTVNSGSDAVRLYAIGAGDLLAERLFPNGVLGRIDGPEGVVTFDRLGHSRDYEAWLTADAGVHRWSVAGLTGMIDEVQP